MIMKLTIPLEPFCLLVGSSQINMFDQIFGFTSYPNHKNSYYTLPNYFNYSFKIFTNNSKNILIYLNLSAIDCDILVYKKPIADK